MVAATIEPPSNAKLTASTPDAAMTECAVVLAGVRKSYFNGNLETHVLNGCDMAVGQGECVYLLGPSGSGKSTLLSILGCILRPDAGTVRILGDDVDRLSSRALARLRRTRIGFMFQRFHLIRGLSAIENVCVPLTLAGVSARAAARRGRELLEMVDLAEHANRQVRRLSVGQCQRVALARALAADPPLVLADEPTASLDADLGQQAMQLLRRLTVEAGKTAIIVTHDPRILRFADRIFVMERGRLVAAGDSPGRAEQSPEPVPRLAASSGDGRESARSVVSIAHGEGMC
jgi:putative ABC transport system ATP-binding protein